MWLPLENWNGRFAGVGNGGWAGMISYPALVQQLKRGNASGSTDTGHPAAPGVDMAKFALGHPEKLVDFASRSEHEMTVTAKALTRAFYGKAPEHSYWIGCSTGGKQGLTEAQRFPDDYDGILAGAPANNWTRLMIGDFDATLAAAKDSAGALGPRELELLNREVLAACDKLDGVADGVLDDPRRCTFDVATLQCSANAAPGAPGTCFTSGQVELARRVYRGAVDPNTGASLYPGLAFGSEPGWRAMLNPANPFAIPVSFYRWLVFADSQWNWKTFDLSHPSDYRAFQDAETKLAPVLSAIDPDLRTFRTRGSKLLQFHGWMDQLISPLNSINYYESVMAFFGRGRNDRAETLRDVQGFYRLYMVPGMAHCGGGPGATAFDLQTPLEQWVEHDAAPDAVTATHSTNGAVDRSRPLCPYPKVAVYKGSGDANDASSFACRDAT